MDPFTLALGIGGIGASLFGQNQTNQMQLQMMQQQQSFQQNMSNTAYQRASSDMQAAGLNPMMMFSSGSAASTPAGAAPSSAVKSGLDADTLQKAVSTAVQSRVANATIDNLVEQNAKIKAETLTETGRAKTEFMRPAEIASRVGQMEADTRNKRAVLPVLLNEALTAKNESSINPGVRKTLDVLGYTGKKADDIVSPVGNIVSTAKGVKSMLPQRTTVGRQSTFDRKTGDATSFEERWHY